MEEITLKHRIASFLATRFKNVKGGYLGRERFILTCWFYRILPFLGFDYCRLIEWQFILRNLIKFKQLKILDVGCTSSLFIYQLTRFGQVWGIDSRPYFENLPKAIIFIQGDVLKMPFPDDYFDCITLVSVIEHIGLGAYGDPLDDNGDFKAMVELKRVLKTDGTLFMTTIIANKYVLTPKGDARVYDETRFNKILGGFSCKKDGYYIFANRWIPVDRKKAFLESPERFGLACLQLIKK